MLWRCKRIEECNYRCEIIADFVPRCCVRDGGFQDWEKDPLEAAAEKAKRTGDLGEYLKLRRELLL